MTCKKCGQYICYNCYSVQDQNEKNRGWILCDNCAEKMPLTLRLLFTSSPTN
jgi:hypothetical protein